MKEILTMLFEHKTLSREKAREVLLLITRGEANHSQLSAFLTVYLMRTITVEELEGFRDALLELCLPIDFSSYEAIDLCGTGGDGKNTFNISTLSSFVVAGAGIKVTKHGNYGVSSLSGSSNVMEQLGYTFTNDKSQLERQLNEAGICFLHAPLFHPAMKAVAPVRKELGMKTFFNMLGPLVNPAYPKYQCTGVYNLELARIYSYILQKENRHYLLVHSFDGYDEISLTGNFKMIGPDKERVIEPSELGLTLLKPKDLFGGDTLEESARIFLKILDGEGTRAQQEVVAANAGMAIHCVKQNQSLPNCIALAKESLESGKAKMALDTLLKNQK